MTWALILVLAYPDNYTIYEKFQTQEQCVQKQETVAAALKQANSKMMLECRTVRPRDHFTNSNLVVNRYVFR
jgi:Mlc titration factor MtfA (ptsG expression regulator)